jgi:prophage regulatory protein
VSKCIEVLRIALAAKKAGIGLTQLYEKLNPKSRYYDPDFPVPVRLGGRSVGIYRHELEAWLESRPRITPEERKKLVEKPTKTLRDRRASA